MLATSVARQSSWRALFVFIAVVFCSKASVGDADAPDVADIYIRYSLTSIPGVRFLETLRPANYATFSLPIQTSGEPFFIDVDTGCNSTLNGTSLGVPASGWIAVTPRGVCTFAEKSINALR